MFGALSVAGSGVSAGFEWLATSAGNVANRGDTASRSAAAYRVQTPVFTPVAAAVGQGQPVRVAKVALGPPGTPAYAPGSPTANAKGVTFYPTESLAGQMVQALTARLSVEANVAVMRHALAAYRSVLALGGRSSRM